MAVALFLVYSCEAGCAAFACGTFDPISNENVLKASKYSLTDVASHKSLSDALTLCNQSRICLALGPLCTAPPVELKQWSLGAMHVLVSKLTSIFQRLGYGSDGCMRRYIIKTRLESRSRLSQEDQYMLLQICRLTSSGTARQVFRIRIHEASVLPRST